MDAGLELRGADPGLEHGDHRRALLIADAVEGVGDVVGGLDLLPDLARRDERVVVHDVGAVDDALDGRPPLRLPLDEHPVRHPGGEGLVQPDVVPPLHRHEVAEPLVGHLVGAVRGLAPLEGDGLLGRRRDQRALAPADQARVLLGAERDGLRDREVVELLVRVGHAEVGLEPLEQGLRSSGRRSVPARPCRAA